VAAGYIKLARCLLDKAIFNNEKLLKVWIWCLLKATHKEHEHGEGLQKIKLLPGQFIFGRHEAAKELKMAESTVWRLMKRLSDTTNPSLEIKSTNKFSIVTVTNWSTYQLPNVSTDEASNDAVLQELLEQQMDNKWTTNEQQMDTYKNVKNVKNENNISYQEIVDEYHSICTNLPKVTKLTDKRKKSINARVNDFDRETVTAVFKKLSKSKWHNGDNDRNWKADFDWIMNPNNFVKILEKQDICKQQNNDGLPWLV
jgi:hypothetical protein